MRLFYGGDFNPIFLHEHYVLWLGEAGILRDNVSSISEAKNVMNKIISSRSSGFCKINY